MTPPCLRNIVKNKGLFMSWLPLMPYNLNDIDERMNITVKWMMNDMLISSRMPLKCEGKLSCTFAKSLIVFLTRDLTKLLLSYEAVLLLTWSILKCSMFAKSGTHWFSESKIGPKNYRYYFYSLALLLSESLGIYSYENFWWINVYLLHLHHILI